MMAFLAAVLGKSIEKQNSGVRIVFLSWAPNQRVRSPKSSQGRQVFRFAVETRAALELLALTFVRPRELRAAEWAGEGASLSRCGF